VDEAEALARLIRIALRVLEHSAPLKTERGAGHHTDPDANTYDTNGGHDHDCSAPKD
jgi:hypothetical protein